MKKSLLFISLCLLFGRYAHAQEEPIVAKSTITDVTVFLSGAQVSEEATVTLAKGDNVLLFSGLAKNIDPRTIQAAAPDIVLINSVSHAVNYLREQVQSPRIAKINDSIVVLNERSEVLRNELAVLTLESQMLNANQGIAGEAKGVSAEELRKLADFFRQRTHDIGQRQLNNTRAMAKIQEDRSRLQRQLQELNAQNNQPSNDIVIKLRSDYARTVRVGIRYLVADAGWVPGYDLRAKDTDSPITLDYRAEVWQMTGVNWKNVNLTLSSGDPRQGGTKPELTTWDLRFGNPGYAMGGATRTMSLEQSFDKISKADDGYVDGKSLKDYTAMRNTATTAEFVISIKQDVTADGERQQVTVQSATLPALYEHYAVPKLDKDAFLVARITGWESLNLLPGQVNIFFEGTYVTKSILDPTSTIDTLDFSLGRDKNIIIERNMPKDFNARKDIGLNRERTFGYEFVVRNTKRSVVHLKMIDQVPVTQDQDIEVKVIELSKGQQDEATGIVTWTLDLKPAETQKLQLVYSVKHPKKKIVPGI